ncbi:Kyphoscoliosis peptidase [Armadillidium vulgare]|nr:Kyphoscoliosis peptidase [Armadillidium vulgare]
MKPGSTSLTQRTKFNQKEWHLKGTDRPVKFKAERSITKVMVYLFSLMIKILHLFYIPACWHIVFLMLYV